MKRWQRLFGIAALVFFALSCAPLELRKARSGVDLAMSELASVHGFDIVKTVDSEFSKSAGGKTCYYARTYVVMGSSLPEMEALDVYSETLQSAEYYPRQKQYPTSRIFFRGSHELVVVGIGEPYVGFKEKDPVNWAQWEAKYRTIMNIRIDYMLPQRDGC